MASKSGSFEMATVKVVFTINKVPQKKLNKVTANLADTVNSFIYHLQVTYRLKKIRRLTIRRDGMEKRLDIYPNSTLKNQQVEHDAVLYLRADEQATYSTKSHVKVLVPKVTTPLRLHVNSDTTLEQVKHLLQNRVKVPAGQQVILYRGTQVRNGPLDAKFIGPTGRTLELQHQTRGGHPVTTNPTEDRGYETEADRPKKPARRDREIEDVVNQIPNTHIPSCQKLLRVAKEMVTWEPEAHLLGLTEPERETILKDHYGDHEEQKYKMLEKWWRKEGREATWRTLASALSKHQEHLVNLIVKLAADEGCEPLPARKLSSPQPSCSALSGGEAPSDTPGSSDVREEEITAAETMGALPPKDRCQRSCKTDLPKSDAQTPDVLTKTSQQGITSKE